MILEHALLALSIALSPPADSLLSPDSMMVELRKGGYTILWRHVATDYTTRDAPGFPNTERSQQRNLTPRGVSDATAIGRLLKLRGVPIGEVVASPMFRTRETATLAFGHTDVSPLLISMSASPEERQLLTARPKAGTNRVLVTHHPVIERNAPGIKPGDIGEGEAVVVRAVGDQLQTVAIFKMADWHRLAEATPGAGNVDPTPSAAPPTLAGPAAVPGPTAPSGPIKPPPPPSTTPLVIPALLETPQNATVAEYLRTFNAGDAQRMRTFLEQRAVPNPARTIDQRLETYARLRGDLGNLTITSAEPGAANQVVVKADGSTGTQGTLTFTLEAAAPYRIASINVQSGP